MQVAVVHIVDMSTVLNGCVTAAGSMDVVMVLMGWMAHELLLSGATDTDEVMGRTRDIVNRTRGPSR